MMDLSDYFSDRSYEDLGIKSIFQDQRTELDNLSRRTESGSVEPLYQYGSNADFLITKTEKTYVTLKVPLPSQYSHVQVKAQGSAYLIREQGKGQEIYAPFRVQIFIEKQGFPHSVGEVFGSNMDYKPPYNLYYGHSLLCKDIYEFHELDSELTVQMKIFRPQNDEDISDNKKGDYYEFQSYSRAWLRAQVLVIH